jgi:uncharacterized membrane protein YdjX (TVP38/TMEM64 family)
MTAVKSPLDPHTQVRHYVQLGIFALTVASLIVISVFWGPLLRQVFTDQEQFKTWIESYAACAALVFVAVQFVQVLLFFIPGEIVQVAGGYIFGTWHGLLLSYLGITLGSITAFAIARLFERGAVDLFVDRRTVYRFNRFVYGRFSFWPLFLLFSLPGVPKDLLSYIAGLTPIHTVTFLLISSVGRFPGMLLSNLLGEGLAERDWNVIGLSVGITLGFMGVLYLLREPIEQFRQKYLLTKEEQELLQTTQPPRSDRPSRP